jgi:hypothetical protein
VLRSSPSTETTEDATAPVDAGDGERGSAALEFILVGLLLLVPLV